MPTLVIPKPAVLHEWQKGGAITDGELQQILRFFETMLVGCEALGDQFLLATLYVGREYDSASAMQWHRQNSRA